MKIKKFVFAVCTLLLSASSLHANDNNCEPKPICEPEPPCCDVPEAPCTTAYNHPGRVDVCGNWDMFITGSFIYWQPFQEGMDVAVLYDDSTAYLAARQESVDMNFDYKPGFKVGLGCNFDHDNWTGYIEYTRLHGSHTTSVSIPSWATGIGYLWILSGLVEDFKTTFKVDLDIIDLELSRWEYRGKHLIFNPFFGLKGGWLDQSLTAAFVEPDPSFIPTNAKFDSWLIGPRGGFYANWNLGEGFSFFDKTTLSLVYQKISDIKASWNSSATGGITNKQANDQHHVIPILEIMLGMNWGSYFDRNNYHFDILAAYELQFFWDQNYLRYGHYTQDQSFGNLSFHGLNITARLDF